MADIFFFCHEMYVFHKERKKKKNGRKKERKKRKNKAENLNLKKPQKQSQKKKLREGQTFLSAIENSTTSCYNELTLSPTPFFSNI